MATDRIILGITIEDTEKARQELERIRNDLVALSKTAATSSQGEAKAETQVVEAQKAQKTQALELIRIRKQNAQLLREEVEAVRRIALEENKRRDQAVLEARQSQQQAEADERRLRVEQARQALVQSGLAIEANGLQRLSRAQQAAAEQYANSLRRTAAEARKVRVEIEEATKSQARSTPLFLQFATFPAADLARRAGLDGLSEGLFAAGSGLGVLDQIQPTIVGIKSLGAELVSIIPAFAGTTAATIGLGTAVGAVALAAAPVVIAFAAIGGLLAEIQRRSEEAQKAGEDYANRLIEIADLIASGATSEDVQGLVNRNDQFTNAEGTGFLDAQQRLISSLIDDFEGTLNQQAELAVSSPTLGSGAFSSLEEYAKAVAENDLAIAALTARANELTGSTGDSVQAIQALIASNERITQQIDQVSTRTTELTGALTAGAFAANDAAAAAEEFADTMEDNLTRALEGASAGIARFNEAISQTVGAINEERDKRQEAYLDAITDTVEAQEKAFEAQQAFAEAEAEHQQRLADIQEAAQDRIAAADEDLAERREKIAKDNADRIAKIERDFTRTYQRAIGDRDAVAASQALQARNDALDDLKNATDEQNATLRKAYEKAIAAATNAANKAVEIENRRAAKQLSTLAQAEQRALILVQNFKNAELAVYQSRMLSIQSVAQISLSATEGYFRSFFNNVATAAQAAIRSTSSNAYQAYRSGERANLTGMVNQAVNRQVNVLFSGQRTATRY